MAIGPDALESLVKMTHDRYWLNRNVLVTGCTGLLGSWLTERLVAEGANVVGLIRDLVPRSNLHCSGTFPAINVVRGELTDYPTVLRALNEYEVDTCFHLAAQTIVTIANRAPLSTFESNIKGTWVVLEALRHTPTIQRIIVASSDKAYGQQCELPYTEEAPLRGLHPYDASKSCADLLAQTYAHTYGLPLAVSRFGNLYGGGDLNFNRLVPGAIRSILHEERPVIRSDGTPLRDYVYIKEAVGCYLTLARALDRQEVRGQAFNFGPQKPLSVLEVVRTILRLAHRTDLEPEIRGAGLLKGEISNQYLSHRKAREVLGWTPRYTFEEGLQETIAWYKAFFQSELGIRNCEP